jgi:hypothetical protein
MKFINKDDMQYLSLSDFTIESLVWEDDYSCVIMTQGAYLEQDDGVVQFNSCKLYIRLMESCQTRCYDHESKIWVNCDNNETLKEISEFCVGDDLTIRGFSKKSGMWVEMKFISPGEIHAEVY